MHYPPCNHSLGFVGPRAAKIAPPTRTVTATPSATIAYDRGAVAIQTLQPTAADYMNLPKDQFRYSEDQIRQMLERGQSETVERSGESDSGLPNASDLEQQANESDASRQFEKDAAGGILPGAAEKLPGELSAETKTENGLLLAALAFLIFGG